MEIPNSLPEAFARICSSSEASRTVVECGSERWTYQELDRISNGLAAEVVSQYGTRPTVAFVSENHPYVLALMLATWKLGGRVAPMDPNTPPDILKEMLRNIGCSCVVFCSLNTGTQRLVEELSLPFHSFLPENSTITVLTGRFSCHSSNVTAEAFDPHDICLYLYTSSASSISNLKCVPLSHKSILSNSAGQLQLFQSILPSKSLDHCRLLGWSPWSHIMGLSLDLGMSIFLTRGCYIFAVVPSTYVTSEHSGSRDIIQLLLEALLKQKADFFGVVPWALDGFRAIWEKETDPLRRDNITASLRNLKVLIAGGAATSDETMQWAKSCKLPLMNGIGMTEVGGALFMGMTEELARGYTINNCPISDAKFTLLDEHSNEAGLAEGELVVTSQLICKDYLHRENTSFSVEGDFISFRTGDLYTRTLDGYLRWKGRKEDFIQLVSGELLDPRELEKTLDSTLFVARTCLIGNKFLRQPSQVVCLIVELNTSNEEEQKAAKAEVIKAVSAINRGLPPPLRITWSRILFLPDGEHLPLTRKRTIFKKKIEDLFGDRLQSLIVDPLSAAPTDHRARLNYTEETILRVIYETCSTTLQLPLDVLYENPKTSFSEFGLTSAIATAIVNTLNHRLELDLPLNVCHIHIDIPALSAHIIEQVGLAPPPYANPRLSSSGPSTSMEDVAIIGQALRLPGSIDNVDQFWDALVRQREDIQVPIPHDRWDHSSFKVSFEKAGIIDYTSFDNAFFSISSSEAYYVCPNVRLALETAFEALEDANIPISRVKGSSMGVFVANPVDNGYSRLLFSENGYDTYSRFFGTGIASSAICGRLSYLLDVHGPSISVDTACSGGLVALHYAVDHLRSGQGDTAIVIGVNTHPWPGSFEFLCAQGMVSPNSRCATFSKEADGYSPSEGVIALILKTRDAAMRDQDRILGLIKATDVQHNGRTQGLIAPSVKAQSNLQESLLRKATLKSSDIDLIETHGTGTKIGDLMEVQGINDVFMSSHSATRPLILGAAKSCIGHTETTSGLVGIVKTIASFEKGIVPAITHLNQSNFNTQLDCTSVPLLIPRANVRLAESEKYRALVLAYGFAGTISGAVLESHRKSSAQSAERRQIPMMFVVSAKTPKALACYIQLYHEYCLKASADDFESICYTSCVGREHYRYRLAFVVSDLEDLIERLDKWLTNSSGSHDRLSNPRVVFGFPGQGSQYPGMASDLAERYPSFLAILRGASEPATKMTGIPVFDLLKGELFSTLRNIDEGEVAQICTFVYQYVICTWLKTLGIVPHAVVGHSLGEFAAAVIAGALDYGTALQIVVRRARLLHPQVNSRSGMAAVACNEQTAYRYIENLKLCDRLVIAVYNAPESLVISGYEDALNQFMQAVKADGHRATRLNVNQGFHSPCIYDQISELGKWIEEYHMVFKPLQLPFYSTALVDRVEKHQCLPDDYWVHHALAPVRFAQTVSRINSASSYDMIMDLGPQRAMWASLQANGLSGIKIIPLRAKAGKDQNLSFLEALSVLYENNISIDFRQLFVGEDGRSMYEKIRLPTYPFQRQRHYPSFIPSRRQMTKQDSFSDANPPSVSYDYPVDQHLCNLLDDHRIDGRRVLPAAGLIYHFCVSPHNEMRSLESIKFHQRFIIDSPFVRAEVSFERKDRCTFSLIQDSDTKICSGIVAPSPIIYPYRQWPSDLAPLYSLTKEEVYNRVRQVAFGPSFQSIQFINVWSDHADGTITVKPSSHPELDAIRKLDACIHMLGGVSPDLVDIPREYFSEGAFLPSSFEGFVVYTDKGILPDSFICRYHLPIQQERNFLVMKTRFEVLSLEGELLAACQKYSVAWIPFSGRKDVTGDAATISWLKTSWRPKSLSINLPPGQEHGFLRRERVLYLANTLNVPLIKALYSSVAKDILFGQLIGGEDAREYHLLSPDDQGNLDLIPLYPRHDSDEFMTIENYLSNKDQKRRVCVVLDTTQAAFSNINIKPDSHEFSVLCKHILWLMKALVGGQIRFSSFVVISAGDTPSDCKDAGLTLSTIGLGSIVQGMLRVFRREMGLSLSRDMVWGIDVSSRLSAEEWKDIIQSEFYSRLNGVEKDSVVTYRRTGPSETEELLRFVMVQEEMKRDKEEATLRADGVTVIAGMGSIACALTRALISSGGARKVVLLGRRSEGDKSVREQLSTVLDSTTETMSYIQTDICDINSLRTTFESIEAHQGTIRNIVHAAGVIRDALIQNISSESFEQVISPKVRGGWNLHRVSEEMGLVDKGLDSFVFLSSISVPFGNPGQVAYVAGNSYLDSLAAYRRSRGLPGLSMQLGPWESRLVEQLQFSSGRSLVTPIEHREGIPLLVKALTLTSADRDDFTASVQLLAKFDSRVMKGIPWIREDPLWDEVTARASDTPRSSNHASEKLWTRKEVEDSIINSLRDVLELREGDLVDLEESLISCGVDSICFAQIQARSISDLGMDIPMAYLSETFTIREMIDYVFGRLEGQSRGMTDSKLI